MARLTREDRASVQFVVPKEAHAALEKAADALSTSEQKYYISDVIRTALAEYFERRGEQVNFKVDRGGWRPREEKQQ